MNPFSLSPKESQELDITTSNPPEPVRGLRIELGHLASRQDEVVRAEDKTESAPEHVEPFVALVRLRLWRSLRRTCRNQVLESLQPSAPARQRNDCLIAATDRPEVDPRVARLRRRDEFVERYSVRSSQGQKQFESRTSLTRLESRQGAD